MNRSSLLVLALGATTLVACDGLKEALTAHVDVAAKAGKQELSVTRLSSLMGKSQLQIPVTRDVALVIARDLWTPYQLLALSAAHGDSLSDPKAIDAAASAMMENTRIGRFLEQVSASFAADSGSEASYAAAKGDLVAARHILFTVPQGAPAAVKDSVRRKAESVRAQLTPANFGAMANQYSQDPGNAEKKGGDLGVFPRTMMVKPFSDALLTLKPGEISPLVETQFGYHIIQRSTWEQARTQYLQQASGRGRQVAESTYIASAQTAAKVSLKSDAAATMKEVAKDPLAHRGDKTAVATYSGGTLTAGRLALVLLAAPQSPRVQQQIQTAPDSLVRSYVTSMAQREVLLARADSAKSAMTTEELAGLHRDFAQLVASLETAIGIEPATLAAAGKTAEERERIAAEKVEAFIDRIMAGQAQPVPVPVPLQLVLLNKYDAKVNSTGIDRAVEQAVKVRQISDSTRAASQPQSAVPLPGGMSPGMPPQGAVPPGAVPQPARP